MRILLAQNSLYYPAHGGGDKSNRLLIEALAPRGHQGRVVARILLAQNSLYYPAHGGGDKSNRLLIEALAARGHVCRVVARIGVFGEAEHTEYLETLRARGVTPQSAADAVVVFQRGGVEVHVVTNGHLRAHFAAQAEAFAPDVILASTDDPAQVLLPCALSHPTARVIDRKSTRLNS